MESIKISFTLTEMPGFGIAYKGGRKTFEFQAFEGRIAFDVPYDCRWDPLRVVSTVKEGDRVELILLPHRIELHVNGELMDEEWPMGNRLYACGDVIHTALDLTVEEYEEPRVEVPSIVSVFRNAEGWRPGGEVYVGDCMPYVRDGEYHVLYLKDRHHHRSKWGMGAHQWDHISTKDFSEWRVHPMAVPITDPSEGSICTGSWIRDGKREYLYYTVRRAKGAVPQPATICRSVSEDGYHFEKDAAFGFILPEIYDRNSARDPKVILGEDGIYHMFLTTTLLEGRKGCLAHFVSRDMETWQDAGEPIYIGKDQSEPECPDYIVYRGHYYLIFSLDGTARYLVSDSPLSGWREPKNPVIPCASVPKGAIWEDRIVFAGFNRIRGYAGTLTFRSATADEDGELVFDESIR